MIDAVGHLGYAVLLMGNILISRRHAAGWFLRLAGDGIWTVLGVLLSMSSIITWGLVFGIIDVVAFNAWRKKQQHHDRETTTVG